MDCYRFYGNCIGVLCAFNVNLTDILGVRHLKLQTMCEYYENSYILFDIFMNAPQHPMVTMSPHPDNSWIPVRIL